MIKSIILGGIALSIIYFLFSTIKNDGVYTPPKTQTKTQTKTKPTSNMEKDIKIIRKWVSFFGILTVANIVIALIYVLSILS